MMKQRVGEREEKTKWELGKQEVKKHVAHVAETFLSTSFLYQSNVSDLCCVIRKCWALRD